MRKLTVLAVAAALLAGCSSVKPYDYSGPSNIRFKTKTETGFLMSLDATVHIYSVAGDCKSSYVGTVDLDKKSIRTGIPVGRLSYMAFRFNSSSFLGGSSSSTGLRATIRPRAGHDYEVEVSYVDNMYDAVVYEINKRTKRRREVSSNQDQKCGL